MQLVEDHAFSVLCSVKCFKFCTVFDRVMKHARHSLFIIASCVCCYFTCSSYSEIVKYLLRIY